MTDFVLVHGAWHGGWCWDPVAALLTSRRHRVFAPCLPGVGERAGEPVHNIGLYDHIKAVVDVIEANDLHDIVLVGHSYGGMVVTGVADRCRARIAELVYLDAFVPNSGQSLRDIMGTEQTVPALELAHSVAGGTHLPVILPAASLVDFTGAALDAFMARLTPQPLMTIVEPVILQHPPLERRSYIFCSKSELGLFEGFARSAAEGSNWRYQEMAAPHDSMLTDPEGLAALLTGQATH